MDKSELNYRSPLSAMCAKAYRKYAFAVLLIELIAAVSGSFSPLAQRVLIDGVNALDRRRVIIGCAEVAVLLGVTLMCQAGSYLLRFRLGVEARCRLKSRVFHSLLGLPESFLKERGSGYFFNRIQSDSTEVVNFYSGDALLQFSALLKFVFAFCVIFFMHWKCALLTLPFLLFQYLLYRGYREKQYRLGHKMQECVAVERYRMQEYLSGHATLKTHNAVNHTTEKLNQGFAHWRTLSFQRLFLENRFRFFSYAPMYLCCGGIAVYGLDRILKGQWSLGSLWALLMLLRQTFTPVQRLATFQFRMQTIQASWDRLRQICFAASSAESELKEEPCSLKGDIEFSHVSFSYTSDQILFQDLNLKIRDKELFFLTGANGSGKTTIFQLLLRLYDPLGGSITIAGRDIRNFSVVQYRSRIGYLGQTPEFFPGTIRENLLLDSTHSDEEIMNIMNLLNSRDLILKRPQGLDSTVTERGQNFSGGERLRLALARELLRDKDILLLDEPAANLDCETRKAFYELLTGLHRHCTIIAIIHDDPAKILTCDSRFSMYRIEDVKGDVSGRQDEI